MATGCSQSNVNAKSIVRLQNVHDGVYHDKLLGECESISMALKIK